VTLQDMNTVDYRMWAILQENVYNLQTRSLIWTYRRRHWWIAAAMTTCLAHFVLSRCFSSYRSVMSILNTFSCYIPHIL